MFAMFQEFLSSFAENEEKYTTYLSYIFLFWGFNVLISLQLTTAPYGRYSRPGWGLTVPARIAWVVQELPSFAVPVSILLFDICPKASNPLNLFAVGLFVVHYFQRTFVFSLLIRGGKPTPLFPFLLAFLFCMANGWLQAAHLLKFNDLGASPGGAARVLAGAGVFLSGMFINIHSDFVLRNLRKPGETGYKIPRGGMFEYISGANFFGEMLEWAGFALACWSLPTFAFALFTSFNIGPRAVQHHQWYKQKFEDYPKNRKAVIPFLL